MCPEYLIDCFSPSDKSKRKAKSTTKGFSLSIHKFHSMSRKHDKQLHWIWVLHCIGWKSDLIMFFSPQITWHTKLFAVSCLSVNNEQLVLGRNELLSSYCCLHPFQQTSVASFDVENFIERQQQRKLLFERKLFLHCRCTVSKFLRDRRICEIYIEFSK